jgi:hypothetical protein
MGLYDDQCVDFSEAFVAFCLSDHYSGFDGCHGSTYDYEELNALVDYGICCEADYPYTDDEQTCPLTAYPSTVRFESWNRVPCSDIEAIKTAIMTYGVVDAAVYAGSAFQAYSGGVYEDLNGSCASSPCYYTPTNHAIALVGWDDNPPEGGGGCWILRNSWGSNWGEEGYMRIIYTSARVACEVCYLVPLPSFPEADFTASPTRGVAPLTVHFTDRSTGEITSRHWAFGDGATSTLQNPSHTYSDPGAYSPTLTVTGPEGEETETKDGLVVTYLKRALTWLWLLLP